MPSLSLNHVGDLARVYVSLYKTIDVFSIFSWSSKDVNSARAFDSGLEVIRLADISNYT